MADRTGQTLGQYHILAQIGHGGFADVYLGEHIFLKTQAAIKVLHAQLASDMMEQFQAEARIIAGLDHEHIVRVRDFGIENATPFLVMDYAPKGTLRQRHPRGTTIALAQLIPYVKQIASALQCAHDRHLIHRDVKPENMLINARDEILLSDFGIATISQTSRSLSTQDISGTIPYMAPEQVQGKARPASDQYSLGIIIYEWLAGRCPFQGSFAEVASQHLFAPPPPLRAITPSIPAEVEEVLMIALAKNPEGRFERVEAFANALEQASHLEPTRFNTPAAGMPPINSSDMPTYMPPFGQFPPNPDYQSASGPNYQPVLISNNPATPPPSPYTPPSGVPPTMGVTPGMVVQPAAKKSGVSRRWLLIGACIAAAALGAGGVEVFLATQKSPRTTGGNTGNGTSTVTNTTPNPTTTTGPTQTATAQPDPTSAPPVVATTFLQRHIGPDKEFTVAWLPHTTRIASAGLGAAGTIEVWDAQSNTMYFTMNAGASKVFRVAWSPDGTKIASSDSNGNVIIWDTGGNQLLKIPAHPNRYANCVAWSYGGTMVASAGGDSTACVWDANTGNKIASYPNHTAAVNAVAWSHNDTFIVSASDDFTAQVWYATSGQQTYTYRGHTDKALAAEWSLDDRRIVTVSNDTTAQVWDSNSGSNYVTYRGHSDIVASVDWSPDGQKIATGSKDHTVQVWSAFNGTHIATFTGHTFEVEGVSWSSDNRSVASASDDGTVQVWQV